MTGHTGTVEMLSANKHILYIAYIGLAWGSPVFFSFDYHLKSEILLNPKPRKRKEPQGWNNIFWKKNFGNSNFAKIKIITIINTSILTYLISINIARF